MAQNPEKLFNSLQALGKYFGGIGARFSGWEGEKPAEADTDAYPLKKLLDKLRVPGSGGGLTTAQMIKEVETYLTKADEKDAEKLQETYSIVYEPEPTCAVSEGDNSAEKPNMGTDEGSMRAIVGNEPGSENLNGLPMKPTTAKPGLSCHTIKTAEFNFSNRNTGQVALFMGSIPSIEFSRCIPFIDITLVTAQSAVSDDGRIQTTSLGQFLMGQKQLDVGSTDYSIVTAVATEFDARAEEVKEEGEVTKKAVTMSSAGMELFTSPQTLVSADEDYDDHMAYQTIAQRGKDEKGDPLPTDVGGLRGTGVIDKFRPFMSLQNFTIEVAPSAGFMSTKTATMTLTLHDRSRLSEIAPFVKPDLFGQTQIIVEYGWNHPDGGPASENDFGVLLNSMRETDKYGVVGSTFTFTAEGEVQINVRLVTKGLTQMQTTSIGEDEKVAKSLARVNKIIEAVATIRSRVMGRSTAKNVSPMAVLSAVSDTQKVATLSNASLNKLKKFMQQQSKAGADPDFKELAAELKKLLIDKPDGETAKQELTNSIAAVVKRRLDALKTGVDPWLDGTPFEGSPYHKKKNAINTNPKLNQTTHVSLAKLMLVFCGAPLALTGDQFTEVQFIFYPFNNKASFMWNSSIANFPINIGVFMKKWVEVSKTSANWPLARFLGFVFSNFIRSDQAQAWGLTTLYTTTGKGKDKKAVLKEKYKKDAHVLRTDKQARLNVAYGNNGASLEFKRPRVQMFPEALKVEGDAAQTLLRIHIMDLQCSSHDNAAQMLLAARTDAMGTLNATLPKPKPAPKPKNKKGKASVAPADHSKPYIDSLVAAMDLGLLEAIPALVVAGDTPTLDEVSKSQFRIAGGFPALKNFIASTMPTIIYGSQNSAVISATVNSITDPAIATVNMQRAGMGSGVDPQGVRDGGLPLQVSPVSLEMKVFGCPAVSFGQEFFVDFGTGTSVDNVYIVLGVTHTLEPGQFETTLNLFSKQAFGKFVSLSDNIETAVKVLEGMAPTE